MRQLFYGLLTLTIFSCSHQKLEVNFQTSCDSATTKKTTYKGFPATLHNCYQGGEVREWIIVSDSLDASYSELRLNKYFIEKTEAYDSLKEVGYAVFIEMPDHSRERKHNITEKYVSGKLIMDESHFLSVEERDKQYHVCLHNKKPDSVKVFITDSFPNVFNLGMGQRQIQISAGKDGKFCFVLDRESFKQGYLLELEFVRKTKPDGSTEIGLRRTPKYFDRTLLKRIKKRHTTTNKANAAIPSSVYQDV